MWVVLAARGIFQVLKHCLRKYHSEPDVCSQSSAGDQDERRAKIVALSVESVQRIFGHSKVYCRSGVRCKLFECVIYAVELRVYTNTEQTRPISSIVGKTLNVREFRTKFIDRVPRSMARDRAPVLRSR